MSADPLTDQLHEWLGFPANESVRVVPLVGEDIILAAPWVILRDWNGAPTWLTGTGRTLSHDHDRRMSIPAWSVHHIEAP